jgi:hypothetical protein
MPELNGTMAEMMARAVIFGGFLNSFEVLLQPRGLPSFLACR